MNTIITNTLKKIGFDYDFLINNNQNNIIFTINYLIEGFLNELLAGKSYDYMIKVDSQNTYPVIIIEPTNSDKSIQIRATKNLIFLESGINFLKINVCESKLQWEYLVKNPFQETYEKVEFNTLQGLLNKYMFENKSDNQDINYEGKITCFIPYKTDLQYLEFILYDKTKNKKYKNSNFINAVDNNLQINYIVYVNEIKEKFNKLLNIKTPNDNAISNFANFSNGKNIFNNMLRKFVYLNIKDNNELIFNLLSLKIKEILENPKQYNIIIHNNSLLFKSQRNKYNDFELKFENGQFSLQNQYGTNFFNLTVENSLIKRNISNSNITIDSEYDIKTHSFKKFSVQKKNLDLFVKTKPPVSYSPNLKFIKCFIFINNIEKVKDIEYYGEINDMKIITLIEKEIYKILNRYEKQKKKKLN